MVGNKCLMSLQPTIFQNIGAMLTELDTADNALAARCSAKPPECNLISTKYRDRAPKYQSRGRGNNKSRTINYRQNATRKSFCRICYHAGSPPAVYSSHPISACSYLTKADKVDLKSLNAMQSLSLTDGNDRRQAISAPGWDTDHEESEDNDSEIDSNEINDENYVSNLLNTAGVLQTNTLIPRASSINPIPSQVIITSYGGGQLPITLDSGATISFIRRDFAIRLNMPIQPNSQTATLADQSTTISAIGEVDVTVHFRQRPLRLKALVVDALQAPCFGGTNFHLDNHVVPDIKRDSISIKGETFMQSDKYSDPLTDSVLPDSKANVISSKSLQVKEAQTILPGGVVRIPTPEHLGNQLLITPSFPGVDPLCWRAQICPVKDGQAEYVNSNQVIIKSPKYAHFNAIPVQMEERKESFRNKPPCPIASPPASINQILKLMKVNTAKLSRQQQTKLENMHRKHSQVFDNDMSIGYNHRMGNYELSFAFKETSSPPPLKVWAPQYNRTCQNLLQAKCDQLEEQGVLVDPMEANVDILHLSPIMIQQKGRARHKKLQDCSLDEVRFISCQNVLNDSIRPIPSTSTSQVKITKFLSRWKYHAFADLHNSYFQIPISRKLWGYMGINTPFRGIKILTRAGQGLLNSDVHLDQLMSMVLGDEITAGIVEVVRDDIQVGGDTIDQLLDNWDQVLQKLAYCNLKISPEKVRILLDDVEVYGIRVNNGFIAPSPHRITDLGNINHETIKTVKQLNSWRGLYKTLAGHLPHLSHFMQPFDRFAATKKSSDTLVWTDELLQAFRNAKAHLTEVNKTYLPRPSDQLILKPDAAKLNICTGWVLYALRNPGDDQQLLPVMYCSAKLPDYMGKWYPCELEAIGAVLAIDQAAHWINESKHTTLVMPDSMPVVKAANLMKKGRHSKNPRLQSLLACINRRNITFVHNSAKRGDHIIPDTLSRLNTTCSCQDCSVTKFIEEIPVHAEVMSINAINNSLASITNIIWGNTNPAVEAVTKMSILNALKGDIGSIPFGNKKIWSSLQHADVDCRAAIDLLIKGNVPTKKNKRKVINKLLNECSVSKSGLLVKKEYDPKILREIEKIVVPQTYLHSIITILHTKLMHPTSHQLSMVFRKYFYAPNSSKAVDEVRKKCDTCVSFSKLPTCTPMEPSKMPQHPGSHMNVDVLRRANQKILICVDMFSGFTTAVTIADETKETLQQALVQAITPIRNSSYILVRSDNAPAFKSLSQTSSPILIDNGIHIELGHEANKNSNSVVDKIIQELEHELKKLAPEGEKISEGRLGHAVTILNTRLRQDSLSSSEIHFSRDSTRGINLHLDDESFAKKKEESRKNKISVKTRKVAPKKQTEISPGDIVVVTNEISKHTARAPHLVREVDGKNVVMNKILHTGQHQQLLPRFSHQTRRVDRKFLTISKKNHYCSQQFQCSDSQPIKAQDQWYPTTNTWSDSEYSSDDEIYALPVRDLMRCEPIKECDPPKEPESGTPLHSSHHSEQEPSPQHTHRLNQPRPLKKGDRVTFFNDLLNRWSVSTLTSGPNKYYIKIGPYHNFKCDDGSTGGHYFHPGGLWSLLSDDQQLSTPEQSSSDSETNSFASTSPYIDDEYCDQMDLSNSPDYSYNQILRPSAASFPDLDVSFQQQSTLRQRHFSFSEPDLPDLGCHQALRSRWRRFTSVVRAWSTNDISTQYHSNNEEEQGREEDGGTATPL